MYSRFSGTDFAFKTHTTSPPSQGTAVLQLSNSHKTKSDKEMRREVFRKIFFSVSLAEFFSVL